MSPRCRRALIALAFACFACIRVLPAPLTRVLGRPEGELRQHLWVSWALARELWSGDGSPLLTRLAGFPKEIRLVPLDPLHQFLTVAIEPLLGVVGATNFAALLQLALLAYAGARLARALGGGFGAETAGMVLALTAPPVLAPWADTLTEGFGTGWWLLLLAELLDPRPRGARVALYGCALLGSSVYLAHGSAPIFVGLFLWRRIPLRWALPITLSAVLVGGVLAWGEAGKGGQLGERERVVKYAANLPPRTVPPGMAAPEPIPDTGVVRHVAAYPSAIETGPRRFVPWSLVGLALAALAARRDRGSVALGLGAATYAALAYGSLGGDAWHAGPLSVQLPTPYDLFWRFYPFAEYAWKPGWHAVPAVLLAIALLLRSAIPVAPAAIGGAWSRLFRAGALLAALLVALECQLRGPTPLPLPASELVPRQAWSRLAAEVGGGVIEFPCRDRWVSTGFPPVADVLLGPIFHGRPLAEAFDRPGSPVVLELLTLLDRLAREADGMTLPPVRPNAPTLPFAVGRVAKAGFTDLLVLDGVLSRPAAAALDHGLVNSGMAEQEASANAAPGVGVTWFRFPPTESRR